MFRSIFYRSFLVLIILSLSVAASSQTKKVNPSSNDKSEMIKFILNYYYQNFNYDRASEFILSTENIDSSLISDLPNAKFILRDSKEIKAGALKGRSIDYLAFTKFERKGARTFVTLESIRLGMCVSEIAPIFVDGLIFEFQKKSGKWRGKHVNSSASSTNCSIPTVLKMPQKPN